VRITRSTTRPAGQPKDWSQIDVNYIIDDVAVFAVPEEELAR